jgi:hypothetical protein
MAIMRLSDSELDKRILDMAENGVYFNSIHEALKECEISKNDIKRSIARLRQQKLLVSVGSRKDEKLGTYYEQIHWIGEKPLLGPSSSIAHTSESIAVLAAYSNAGFKVQELRISIEKTAGAILTLTLFATVLNFCVFGSRVVYISALANLGLWAGLEIGAISLKNTESKIFRGDK